jgi:glycosyltransferase involved in cell wall biosynthesis
MNILFLLVGDKLRASVRYRATQFFPLLEKRGFKIDTHFPTTKKSGIFKILSSYQEEEEILRKAQKSDIIFVEKRLFRIGFLKKLKNTNRKIVFDFDDAIMESHNESRSNSTKNRALERFHATCAISDLVLAGNKYLASKVPNIPGEVITFPTVVNFEAYQKHSNHPQRKDELIRLGWIGQPVNYHYLEALSSVFENIHRSHPNAILTVISKGDTSIKTIPIEHIEWSEETEIDSLSNIDIGLMPLPNDEYAKGKCSLKAIQYMAMGIPVIASNVGGNADVIRNRTDGYVINDADWTDKISHLINNQPLREKMGNSARCNIKENFSLESAAIKMAKYLTNLHHRSSR